MDLDTENRIASMLLKEAAELRRQAEQDGVLAYLKKPSVRARPNSRFLTSTVLGVEQANRAVEVNEMWRVRQKEKELDNRIKGRSSHGNDSRHNVNRDSPMTRSHSHDPSHRYSNMPSSSKRNQNGIHYRPDDEELRDDDGLKDDEVEEFLRSRAKRGRGSIGSRMDEMGPYISQSLEPCDSRVMTPDHHARDERWSRLALGPARPPWKSKESSGDDESEDESDRRKKSKKSSSKCTKKHHSKKHKKSKEKDRDKKRKKSRDEKRYK